ncbi:hypothetical protein [Streptomyces sp. MZ04]|uniref:hypothetical protein n=1 Tax=Streptomyces sp. MZ04 TaxID=2559236 RepID=UPI00107E898F|nr:hypothetical protein [Streptomyces sp. MZ04]TGB13030.1 hypothetical protein E2651_10820 [Streptomyces sp. MZ04]
MPRPTPAQLTYGTVTVVFSTLAMLLLSQTSSGIGVAVIAAAALGLGLLVAMTVPQPKPAAPAAARVASVVRAAEERVPVRRAAAAPVLAESVREPAGP